MLFCDVHIYFICCRYFLLSLAPSHIIYSHCIQNPDPYQAPAENDQEDDGSIDYLNRKYGSLYSPMFTKDPWREFGAGQS